MKVVASNKPKSGKGASGAPDTYHLAEGSETVCGRDAADWITLEEMGPEQCLASAYCCKRCKTKYEAMVTVALNAWINLHGSFPGEKKEPTAGDVVEAIYSAMIAERSKP